MSRRPLSKRGLSGPGWMLLVAGLLACLIGLVWIGQGTGIFPYPRESFMIDQRPWAWRGGAVAVAGLLLVGLARRLRRG